MAIGATVSVRQVTSILIKRQHINLSWDADDKYGHWWFEIGNPRRPGSESAESVMSVLKRIAVFVELLLELGLRENSLEEKLDANASPAD